MVTWWIVAFLTSIGWRRCCILLYIRSSVSSWLPYLIITSRTRKKTLQGGCMSVVVHRKPDVNTLLFKTSYLHIHDKGVFVVYLFYWLGCVISIAFEEYTKQV